MTKDFQLELAKAREDAATTEKYLERVDINFSSGEALKIIAIELIKLRGEIAALRSIVDERMD